MRVKKESCRGFAERLRETRKAHGISCVEMAERLDITQQGYSYYETGKAEPPLATVRKICDFYGTSADYLLGTSGKGMNAV